MPEPTPRRSSLWGNVREYWFVTVILLVAVVSMYGQFRAGQACRRYNMHPMVTLRGRVCVPGIPADEIDERFKQPAGRRI